MIPKIIHYCWFGDKPLSDLAKKCIESWQKYCPDYEIRKWDENTIDINSNNYMKEAYEKQCWGFVPDVARLQIILKYGGIYLDTDVELIKGLDMLLDNDVYMGIEKGNNGINYVALGLGFGAVPNHPVIRTLLNDYEYRRFINEDGSLNKIPAPQIQTSTLKKMGFNNKYLIQTFQGVKIYPSDYFCPKSYLTGYIRVTDNTYSIHHYSACWLSVPQKIKYRFRILLIHILGYQRFKKYLSMTRAIVKK